MSTFTPDTTLPERERLSQAAHALREWLTTEEIERMAVLVNTPAYRKGFKWSIIKDELKTK